MADIEQMNKNRESEDIDPSEIPMNPDEFEGQSFVARVHDVLTTSEYILNSDGEAIKERGKHPHVTCLLETDFMEEGEYYTWKWRVSNSKKGTHMKVLQAIGNVKVISPDGKDTGQRGIKGLSSIGQLVDQTFKFEKQDLQFGKNKQTGEEYVKRDFPMPIEYYMPGEGDSEDEEEEKEEE